MTAAKPASRKRSGGTITRRAPAPAGPVALLVATRKGAFILKSDPARRTWKTTGPHFFGHIVHHMVLDPRDGKALLVAARTGHLGPTVFRSTDFGRSWKGAARLPAFAKAAPGAKGRVVDHVFWLTPGHATEPGTWYAGTSPQGLFRSADGGATWSAVAGFNDHPMLGKWTGDEQDGTPDGPKLHSINVDPSDARYLYVGMSGGGVFESPDAGRSGTLLNLGCAADFIPFPDPVYGHHPHCVRVHPIAPDILYQQNHCGIYRMQRSGAGGEHQGGVTRHAWRGPPGAAPQRGHERAGCITAAPRRRAGNEDHRRGRAAFARPSRPRAPVGLPGP